MHCRNTRQIKKLRNKVNLIQLAIEDVDGNVLNVKPDWNASPGSTAEILNKPTIPVITGKADKVSGATNGHIAALDANGNLIDSNIASDIIITSSSVRNVVVLTQSQYDALSSKDANTEYNIVDSL